MNHARIELSLSDALIDFAIYPTGTCHVPWEMNPIPECAVRGTIKVQLIAGLVPVTRSQLSIGPPAWYPPLNSQGQLIMRP